MPLSVPLPEITLPAPTVVPPRIVPDALPISTPLVLAGVIDRRSYDPPHTDNVIHHSALVFGSRLESSRRCLLFSPYSWRVRL